MVQNISWNASKWLAVVCNVDSLHFDGCEQIPREEDCKNERALRYQRGAGEHQSEGYG